MNMTQFYDTIARYYDAENSEMTDDLALYSALAEIYDDPILDVGCGTGRVMLHLAQEGYRCVGVDTSAFMIERGQRKLTSLGEAQDLISFEMGDILNHQPTEPYQLILLPYHLFMHFRDQDTQLKVLAKLADVLAEDGIIVFDLPNAGEVFATQDDDAIRLDRTFIEPETGHTVMQQSVSQLDRVTQELFITWIYDEITEDTSVRRTLANLVLRYVFFSELQLLLAANGLEVREIYGDYDESPFEDGCPRMIVVAGKSN